MYTFQGETRTVGSVTAGTLRCESSGCPLGADLGDGYDGYMKLSSTENPGPYTILSPEDVQAAGRAALNAASRGTTTTLEDFRNEGLQVTALDQGQYAVKGSGHPEYGSGAFANMPEEDVHQLGRWAATQLPAIN